MVLTRALLFSLVSSIFLLPGCVGMSTPPDPSSPYFDPDPGDIKRYYTLAQRQEMLFPDCEKSLACAHVHFTRALVGLFENRETAMEHFQKVIDLAPSSRLAASSQLWIQLLEEDQEPSAWNQFLDTLRVSGKDGDMLETSNEQLVRDLLEREMIIQQLMHMKELDSATLQALQRELSERGREVDKLTSQQEALEAKQLGDSDPSIKKLQQQLAVRDKKIRELNSQLEALKRIDQEMREKTRPAEPPPVPAAPAVAEPPTLQNNHQQSQ